MNLETSKKILQIFNEKNFLEGGSSSQHIITSISNVFIDNLKAYKIYKGDNKFFNESFNDLSKKENRFLFTRKDFSWNHDLSPEIYLELRGVTLKDDSIIFSEATDDVDDLVIVMNKINMADVLVNRLKEKRISLNDCYEIGAQLGKRVAGLPKEVKGRNLYQDFVSRYKDMIAWVAGAAKHIPNDEAKIYLNQLLNFIEKNKDKFDKSPDLMGPCLDIHADNAVFTNNLLLPIDTYAPKEEWLWGYKFLNVYRVATDIFAFLGKEYFNQVLKGYEDSTQEALPREFDKDLILYCELITCPYQYMLSENDHSRLEVAAIYHRFLREISLMR